MKSPRSIFSLCALLVSLAISGPAEPLTKREEIADLLPKLDDTQIDQLIETGELSHMIEPENGPLLVPGEEYELAITEDLEGVNYTIGVEVLNIMSGDWEGFDTVTAANLLLELSTLEGLEYYSASRERMRTLFVQSFAIDDVELENRVPDPTVAAAPAEGGALMFQEDMTFGKNKLRVHYVVSDSTIHMVTENITSFFWGPIRLIRPGRMRLHVLIYEAENFILYYGNFGAKAIRISILEKRIYNSFYNRLTALYGWFEQKLPAD